MCELIGYLTHGCLQDGVESPLRCVQVARYSLLLQDLFEGVEVTGESDDVLEGERRVTVRPRLLQPDRQTGGQTDRWTDRETDRQTWIEGWEKRKVRQTDN